jgi:phospholipid/cholesterol/gamma-HCH transport system ATP-binding protein
VISVEGVSKAFGPRQVLKDISLDVDAGEVLAVMGSSGGGKTTLLKCISGLIPFDSGKVTVDDISVQEEPEKARKRMGMVFQSAALFDYLNVRDNILFGARRQELVKPEDEETFLGELLDLVELEDAADLMPSELSGGMRKRVGLARALACKPSVLLYDEPTTGLDPITTYTIDALIAKTTAEGKVASLLVSHDVVSVYRVATKVAFLEAGELTFYGLPEDFAKSDREAIQELVQKAEAKTFIKTR